MRLAIFGVLLALAAAPETAPLYVINEAGVFGFIDGSGARVVSLPAAVTEVRPFSEGLAAVARRGTAGERWGYIDGHGTAIIAPRFDSAGDFSEGLAAVIVNGRLGYIDRTGAFAIRPQFTTDRVADAAFKGGMAAVANLQSRYGYVDRHGQAVIPFRYISAAPFADDRGRVSASADGRSVFGYVDRAGQWIVRPRFSQARDFSEGLAAVVDGSHAAFIDRDGQTAVSLEPQDLAPCPGTEGRMPGSFSEGLAAVRIGCQWGFVDRTGATVIPPAYFNVGPFSGGAAPVDTGGAQTPKWGYIDRHGQMTIAAQFSTAAPFEGALALVQMGGSDEELVARAMLRGLEDDAANASIKAQAKANIHPGSALRKPELAYVDTTGRIVWRHAR